VKKGTNCLLFKPWQCIEAEEKSVIKMAEQGDAWRNTGSVGEAVT
jgi:hypothetical protein